ncbi:MAG: sarcosine oxidase subunit alpha family protein [Alphaproteobacteria bacterium]|nr:sarcosine oxidase subunit alpha family protein [Alphaproteobacteria bacterium]
MPSGGRIDRGDARAFSFNGRRYYGFSGDTLASALLANGVHFVGRSFKYHRPRGVLGSGAEEPNALVQLGAGARTDPNMRATTTELFDGLRAASQNCWPTLRFDIGGINDRLSGLLPAGFYYKTFMQPARLWKLYEKFIRRAAGLGRAPTERDPDRYDQQYAHCDVLVVGAGPAGLAAALAAGRTGARVFVVDEQAEFGGTMLAESGRHIRIRDTSPDAWREDTIAALEDMSDVTVLPRTTAFGYYTHNFIGMLERLTDHLPRAEAGNQARQRLWKLRAKEVVLATGSIERPLVFAENDRPGILLAGAAREFVNRYAVAPGTRAVVFTNNDSAYAAALDMAAAGVAVEAVIDLRTEVEGDLPRLAREAGIPVLQGYAVVATSGRHRVTGVTVMRLNDAGDGVSGTARKLRCDCVAVSGGWNPAVHLFSQSRGKLNFQSEMNIFVPGESVQAARSAGACNGSFSLAECLKEGADAGLAAARVAGFEGADAATLAAIEPADGPQRSLWRVPSERKDARMFVDFQNDVTTKDLDLAVREGYRSIEHVKRYTTTGMGTDQGKTGNVNALAIVAGSLGAEIPAVGVTTFRAPYTPVTFGAIAGRHVGGLFDPVRGTPMHEWHVQCGAKFEDVGQWKRAWYYPREGETMRQAVDREVRAARESVGILDYSTLGKIDIRGPDAAAFLNRVYTNAWTKLGVGRCRYGLMLRDDGMVMDDGVTLRLGENHFLMTTTTGNAASVLSWLEEWLQTEWPELQVYCTSVTEQYATISICGPNARALLGAVAPEMRLGGDVFPHMSMQEGMVAGVAARVLRVSFTGEIGFEINVPARHGRAVWDALIEAGAPHGITSYGTEAMHVLRAEKGFVIAGQESDGTVTPIDLGMDWIVNWTKGDFIGRRSLNRSDTAREDRKQLVGLFTADPQTVLDEGSQIVERVSEAPPMDMIGHVTSSYYSPNLGRSIALAMIRSGRGRLGETLYAPMPDGPIEVTVTSPVFFDPEGTRLNG